MSQAGTQRHFPKPRNSAGRDLKAAITTGVILIAVALTAIFVVPALWYPLVALATAAATWEVTVRLREHGYTIVLWALLLGGQAMVWGSFFAELTGLMAGFAATVLVTMFSRLFVGGRNAKPENFVRDTALSIMVTVWIPLFASFAAMLSHMERDGIAGSAFIITFVMCVVASDTCGYIAGVMFGKHPLAPAVSPKKSIEGFVGSLIGGGLVGMLFVLWLLDISWWVGILLGIGLAICATLGDLVESQFKRELGIKDMSNLLPGHGGIMDRLDGLLPAAAATWIVLSLIS
ncbi:MAG: phosphatidate cytidylyltransferase [Corynebacterium sp.]|nr:phosphatidate cytidylyltransferase [Corynebacterium sp.]